MSETEVDLRLQRLLFFLDGVCAIAVTLLAVELVLPEGDRRLPRRHPGPPLYGQRVNP